MNRATRRSSLDKMMEILDLFEESAERWTPDRMMKRLGCPRSTLYRYLRVLGQCGLITSLPDVGYTLGPRIAELDYEMRASDPLIGNGRPLLQTLADETAGVGLLCRYFKDRVLCVHQEAGAGEFRSAYDRGRAMPFARGAASRIILAYLKTPQLQQLYASHAAEFAKVGLGRTFAGFQENLARLRELGYCATRGEITPGALGVAAAIFDGEGAVLGSLSVTVSDASMNERKLKSVIERVCFSARVLSNAMRRDPAAAQR